MYLGSGKHRKAYYKAKRSVKKRLKMNKLDNPLNVTKSYDRTLKMFYSSVGISCYVLYNNSKYEHPQPHFIIGWEEWDRMLAWVELSRKEEALEKYQDSLKPKD
jgi:hypothetical protein